MFLVPVRKHTFVCPLFEMNCLPSCLLFSVVCETFLHVNAIIDIRTKMSILVQTPVLLMKGVLHPCSD